MELDSTAHAVFHNCFCNDNSVYIGFDYNIIIAIWRIIGLKDAFQSNPQLFQTDQILACPCRALL